MRLRRLIWPGMPARFTPVSLSTIGRHILAHLDQDGPPPGQEPEPAAAAGELRWRERRDGRLGLEGFLEAEHGAVFRSLIEQFAAPPPATAGIPDPRTAVPRNADALLEVCGLARAAQDCPTTAGEPPHLSVTMGWEALRTGRGSVTLDYGTHLSASAARRWAGDAKVIPIVLGGASEPLDVGRAMRTVPLSLRRALVARDRGCAFPGCDRPPGLCQAHHCRNWVDGGDTSVENCVLLCEPITGMCITLAGRSSSALATSSSSHQQSSTPTAGHCTTHSAASSLASTGRQRSECSRPTGSDTVPRNTPSTPGPAGPSGVDASGEGVLNRRASRRWKGALPRGADWPPGAEGCTGVLDRRPAGVWGRIRD